MSELQIVNPVPADEVAGWLATMSTTFFGDPHADQFAREIEHRRRYWLPERAWGAHDRRWVGTLATQPRGLTVPGPDGGTTDLVADALTNVTVAATHRRRGLLTTMLTASLAAARDRGDAVSILVAAQWPIYGRFGYAPATRYADYTYFPRSGGGQVTPSGRGTVRQVDPAEAGRLGPAIFAAARRRRVGQVDRPEAWWRLRFGAEGGLPLDRERKVPTYVLHEGPNGPDGLVAWRPEHDFDLLGNLARIELSDLVAATDDAYRDLWAYVGGIDAVGEVAAPGRAVDEQLRWLLPDGRALRQTYAGDHVWLRLLDVPGALAARAYAVEGLVRIEVHGDAAGYANGTFALDAGPDGAECTPTTRSPDLRLSHRALAGAYLGGFRLRELAVGGGVEELTPGALGRLDVMLAAAQEPWNATGF